jgi:hypothetical protein
MRRSVRIPPHAQRRPVNLDNSDPTHMRHGPILSIAAPRSRPPKFETRKFVSSRTYTPTLPPLSFQDSACARPEGGVDLRPACTISSCSFGVSSRGLPLPRLESWSLPPRLLSERGFAQLFRLFANHLSLPRTRCEAKPVPAVLSRAPLVGEIESIRKRFFRNRHRVFVNDARSTDALNLINNSRACDICHMLDPSS